MLLLEHTQEQGVRDFKGVDIRAGSSSAYDASYSRHRDILSDGGDVSVQSLLGSVLAEKAVVVTAVIGALRLESGVVTASVKQEQGGCAS